MMDFDPRDYDNVRDRDERKRERDDDDGGPRIGRGPSCQQDTSNHDSRDREEGRRRDPDVHPRQLDPRDVFMRDLDLPKGRDRERVYDARDREYTLRGSETRALSTVGAFRVVPASDLRDHADRPTDPRAGDLRHLREEGLVDTVRLPGRRDVAVVLTNRGRDLLQSHRARHHGPRQEFYAGLKRARELEHDSQVYRAYLDGSERLDGRHARIDRVVLDYELKREYQQWLHERDRGREDSDGHHDRAAGEIEQWALDHDLPDFDDQVHFP